MPQEPTPAIPALTISTGALPALPLPLNASNASGEGDDDSDGNAVAAAAIGVHSPPYPKGIIHPRYPRQALARGIEGRVLLRFTVDTAGRPKQIQVVESTPQGLFDSAAITAIQQTPFQPGMDASGKAVEATLTLPVTFRIHQLSP